jgi:RNA polymerase sigma factor (sigma-70 family)
MPFNKVCCFLQLRYYYIIYFRSSERMFAVNKIGHTSPAKGDEYPMKSVRISENLTISAKKGLANGDDTQFNQLVGELNTHRKKWVASFSRKFPSIAPDLDSEYLLTLWKTVEEFDGTSDFMRNFNTALKRNAIDLYRRENRHAKRSESFEKMTQEDGNLSIVPLAASAEDAYFDRDEMIDVFLDDLDITGAYARAAIKARYKHGLSYDEVPNISGYIFRNKQQVWRQTVAKAKKATRGKVVALRPVR